MHARGRFIALTLVAAVALGPLAASASPKSNVPASQAALQKAIRRYDAAQAALRKVQAQVAQSTSQLDMLVRQQSEAESRLSDRAIAMYRSGPLGYLEVLVGSATFDQFLSTWNTLLRLQREDARAIGEAKRARTRVTRAVARLIAQQEDASRRVRALDAAKARARRDLAASQAAYAVYKQQIAAREAAASSSHDVSAASASPAPNPAASSGSTAPWKTALASHYGSGSYGVHLASGYTIGPDSMIVAHKTLPFRTLVEFSYNGRTAVAVVADRGPYYPGREFDLGPGLARVLGFRGVHQVRYRVIGR